MRRRLDRFVKNGIFQADIPAKASKQFFPRLKTIRSHMVETLRKLRYSKIDQECLSKKMEQSEKNLRTHRIGFIFNQKEQLRAIRVCIKASFFLNWN